MLRRAIDRSVHGSCAYRRRHDGGDVDAYECESRVVCDVAHRPDRMSRAAESPDRSSECTRGRLSAQWPVGISLAAIDTDDEMINAPVRRGRRRMVGLQGGVPWHHERVVAVTSGRAAARRAPRTAKTSRAGKPRQGRAHRTAHARTRLTEPVKAVRASIQTPVRDRARHRARTQLRARTGHRARVATHKRNHEKRVPAGLNRSLAAIRSASCTRLASRETCVQLLPRNAAAPVARPVVTVRRARARAATRSR